MRFVFIKGGGSVGIFRGVNCKCCKYERLYLRLCTENIAPVRSRKCSCAQEKKWPPSRGNFYALTRKVKFHGVGH